MRHVYNLLLCFFLSFSLAGQVKLHQAQLDASNRLRVSQQTTLGDYRQTDDKLPIFFDEEIIGGATSVFSSTESGVVLTVSDSGDAVVRQTFQRHNYQSGKSHLIEATMSDFDIESGVIKRVGYFTADTVSPFDTLRQGIYLENDGEDIYLVIKRAEEEPRLRVSQKDWNVQNFWNATYGKSTINWENFNVLVWDFLYLGGTQVRFGIFDHGQIKWCHRFDHAGEFDSPMINTPNLPIRYEIRSTGGAGDFNHICSQVSSEGAISDVGAPIAISNGSEKFDASDIGTRYVVLALRLAQDHLDIVTEPLLMQALAANNDDYLLELILGGTPSGALSFSNISETSLEVAYGDEVITLSGGHTMGAVFGSGNSTSSSFLNAARKMGHAIDGERDVLYICVTPLSANLDVFTTITIKELQ